ncbi:hypothetical protein BE17_08490 [Sorangium cellulosum]|uniref:Uncharacterized protein n=1 Tax=Sorangium cellulosum TaxID=56 RepID=A0A150RWS2_SORCE|nr:hypothetical protein BE17_08490 [Sorangium cellulosum]
MFTGRIEPVASPSRHGGGISDSTARDGPRSARGRAFLTYPRAGEPEAHAPASAGVLAPRPLPGAAASR